MAHGVTKQQIIEAADALFYEQGFENTSFADIAERVSISRGNLYHHFKAKNDILDAVIAVRLQKAQSILAEWDLDESAPLARIELYMMSLLINWEQIRNHGCPNGSLCTELAKLKHPAEPDSVRVLKLYRTWLRNQFAALNLELSSDELAMDVLAWSQGMAVTANAFKDHDYLQHEIEKKRTWLRTLSGVDPTPQP